MHEIVTLQLGHQANYVGTHFWNAQESYFTYGDEERSDIDHNVHFRPGIGNDGTETFTPRALLYDLKGGFGTLRKINALYEVMEEEDPASQGLWDNGVVTQRQKPIESIQYQKDLEAGVFPPTPLTASEIRYWSDYNRIYYHPRSSVQIDEYELNSGIQPFEGYGLGQELFKGMNREHELLDRDFRLFAEECDAMQGIQIFTSTDDAWAGFAGQYISELRDEYGKVGICTWGLERGERVARDKQIGRTVTLATALSTIASASDIFTPLRIPPAVLPGCLTIDTTSQWHNSALLAAAIETATLPTRLHARAGGMGRISELASLLNVSGNQRIAMLSMSVVSGPEKSTNEDDDERVRLPKLSAITDETRIECSWDNNAAKPWRHRKKEHIFAEANVSRGFDEDEEEEAEDSDRAEDSYEEQPIISRLTNSTAFPVVDSFPHIFPTIGDRNSNGIEYAAVNTRLITSTAVIERVKAIKDVVSFRVGVDEREALLNDLGEIVDGYQHGWNSDSDDDDD
ncbi:Similar to Protein dml1; acc. no. A2QAY5 [Pyronema omphalodes CBS 100304]|uniref:Similar to Protein dml1 acc. no. A2QAY5 n=1 Tax=Pyronema omphalodes (strain CBS 100304) TaxID=1076935 RepID=U4L166_PYROM|nr:Similar to Protein dml1; acc. no. A2QAY5 [Pyronema omphalodes CBS 100304]